MTAKAWLTIVACCVSVTVIAAESGPHGGGKRAYHGKEISDLAKEMPFAYYPSLNLLEVAMQLPAGTSAPEVGVRVVPAAGGQPLARGTLKLDAEGRGQGVIDLPDLPDGDYAVEYEIAGQTVKASRTFKRIHFPWEKNTLGDSHAVYSPFTPVQVTGKTVSIVDRTYTLNGFGLFDSVVSKGRELLAAPITVVCETADGRETWTPGGVTGAAKFEDQAVFSCRASCAALATESTVEVEEDGCATIAMKLVPVAKPRTIRRMWLEIPIKDAEAPLFHYAAEQAIRFNYGGKTPRGRNITWDVAKKGWWPTTYSAEPGPDDAVLWDSTKTQTFLGGRKRPFVPYVWLGGEERGLAWFAETDRNYIVDRKQPVQVLSRENGVVYLRVHLAQVPFVLDRERTLVFALQASPTKPLEKGWRTRTMATGVGPVVCWGGYLCSSKYPDKRDFQIADKIQEARRTGKVDRAWFEQRDKQRRNPDEKPFGNWPWLDSVLHFADFATRSGAAGSGVYFEEHATESGIEEWQVFQDEWSNTDFQRFRTRPGGNVARASYRDFTLFYANEWMKRGVSLYFDNTMPHISSHRRLSDAYLPTVESIAALTGAGQSPDIPVPDHLAALVHSTLPAGDIQWCNEIFGPRRYYRRIWKLAKEWNAKGAPYPIDVTFHMTNTNILPFASWCTAVLEIEQENRNEPWPPDYVRAVIMHRRSGDITFALDYLNGQPRNQVPKDNPPEMELASWGMGRVHDIRGGHGMVPLVAAYDKAFREFGYGEDDVAHHNYWDEKPFAEVADPQVPWLAMRRPGPQPAAMILLQSYHKEAATTRVALPGAVRFTEVHTGEELAADAAGGIASSLPANYGTRLYRVDLR